MSLDRFPSAPTSRSSSSKSTTRRAAAFVSASRRSWTRTRPRKCASTPNARILHRRRGSDRSPTSSAAHSSRGRSDVCSSSPRQSAAHHGPEPEARGRPGPGARLAELDPPVRDRYKKEVFKGFFREALRIRWSVDRHRFQRWPGHQVVAIPRIRRRKKRNRNRSDVFGQVPPGAACTTRK